MQKLIIIRGHSGSGKSTFAQQKISEFQVKYPNAQIYHIENDKFLEQDGEYHWTPERFRIAKKQAEQALSSALDFAKQNPQADILIVLSNVGAKANAITDLVDKAKNQRMVTEVYHMQNFFKNTHNVRKSTVYAMFIDINNNPVENEIFVPTVQPMSKRDRVRIEALSKSKMAE
ncbi:hypothetical protein BMT54_00755 [Pasteurellaceae bacterium 15-036681]|nr:hypothetical protein BMT54_00755 [Pasteurellaceae bacterium 15-036681]